MESPCPQLLILADAPDALVELFGISMLERLLRVAQRFGYREAVIVSKTPDLVATHLAKPSWARSEVALKFRLREADPVLIRDVVPRAERILLVSAGFYYDARLLKALSERDATTLLVDSAPPSFGVIRSPGCRVRVGTGWVPHTWPTTRPPKELSMKKLYVKPMLRCHGSFAALTQQTFYF